ncbi:MAG: hypothetical protein ABSG68_13425, partial [Thermoguttaceae bacterium]
MPPEAWICPLLALITLAAFWGVWTHEFVYFDDPGYVFENVYVQQGLTWDNVRWAFTTGEQSNWHPLTWLSHMLDITLFGPKAGPHHAVNLVLHTVNVLLLFWWLRWMTGAVWSSGVVAALFAVHPLHVESVAWVAERKDMLSTLIGLLTLLAYLYYSRRPGLARYALVFLLFGLGLLAKPMLVTLPFVLLLLDYWPLNRIAARPRESEPQRPQRVSGAPESRRRQALARESKRTRRAERSAAVVKQGPDWQVLGWLVLEKVPLVCLSLASSWITCIMQDRGGSMASAQQLPLNLRIMNALGAYISYIGVGLWPHNMAPLYLPHEERRLWLAALAIPLLLTITMVVA